MFIEKLKEITEKAEKEFGIGCEVIFFNNGDCGVDSYSGECEIDFKSFEELVLFFDGLE